MIDILARFKAKYKQVFIEFLPWSIVGRLKNENYEVYSKYADFWNLDIEKTVKTKELKHVGIRVAL